MAESERPRKMRALLFEDDDCVRQVVAHLLRRRGYEVVEYPHPLGVCERNGDPCPCGDGETCADVILSDIKMPHANGLDFLDGLTARGCRVRNLGLMSAFWTSAGLEHADRKGYRVFKKPAGIWEIDRWLDECGDAVDLSCSLVEHFRSKPGAAPPATEAAGDAN